MALFTININADSTFIPCNSITQSGGVGVTEFIIPLNSIGDILIFDFNGQGIPDKLEIIHNNVKKATSGMTTPNEGPFDDIYGNPTIPTVAQTLNVDQFIGTNKGVIPTRQSELLAETGNNITLVYQQLIWWVYTNQDFFNNPNVVIRITGPSGTGWDVKRICI